MAALACTRAWGLESGSCCQKHAFRDPLRTNVDYFFLNVDYFFFKYKCRLLLLKYSEMRVRRRSAVSSPRSWLCVTRARSCGSRSSTYGAIPRSSGSRFSSGNSLTSSSGPEEAARSSATSSPSGIGAR